jgi:hypothetical protein
VVTHIKDLKIDLGCSVSLGDVLKVCVYKSFVWRGDISYVLQIFDHIVYVIYNISICARRRAPGEYRFCSYIVYVYMC